jgi:CspA family cold shock protein
MNFRDRWVEDEQGKKFIFTVEMQRRLSQAGLPIDPSALAELEAVAASQPRTQVAPPRPPQPRPSQSPAPYSSQPPQQREPEIVGPETIQIDPMTGKYIGRVKWYNDKKGYGFIVRGAGEEIFFHKSATVGEMEEFEEGQWVLYDVETTAKGPEASDVEPYTGEPVE